MGHGALYFMLMLPSKVMPYLLRLAAPLMDSSIVHWNDDVLLSICNFVTNTNKRCNEDYGKGQIFLFNPLETTLVHKKNKSCSTT